MFRSCCSGSLKESLNLIGIRFLWHLAVSFQDGSLVRKRLTNCTVNRVAASAVSSGRPKRWA